MCSYISRDNVIPTKVVKIFPNNKSWASTALKGLIRGSKNAFNEGDVTAVKETKREIKAEMRKTKIRYRDETEAELGSNSLRQAWNSMKSMTGSIDKIT